MPGASRRLVSDFLEPGACLAMLAGMTANTSWNEPTRPYPTDAPERRDTAGDRRADPRRSALGDRRVESRRGLHSLLRL